MKSMDTIFLPIRHLKRTFYFKKKRNWIHTLFILFPLTVFFQRSSVTPYENSDSSTNVDGVSATQGTIDGDDNVHSTRRCLGDSKGSNLSVEKEPEIDSGGCPKRVSNHTKSIGSEIFIKKSFLNIVNSVGVLP